MSSETGARRAAEHGKAASRLSEEPQPLQHPVHASERDELMKRLRAAIQNGTYRVDSLQLSKAIVDRHIRLK